MDKDSDLIKTFTKRIDNPISITFITVFVIYNWQFFYYLLLPFDTKSDLSRVDLALNSIDNILYFFLGPIIIAGLYLAIMPYLVLWYEKFLLYMTKESEKEKQKTKTATSLEIYENIRVQEGLLSMISTSEKRINELKSSSLNYNRNRVRRESAEKLYDVLTRNRKEEYVRAINSLHTVLNLDRSIKNDGNDYMKILDTSNGDIKISSDAVTFLEKYNEEFPGGLNDDGCR
ncbi:MAG: hypothetical protein H6779_00705 [Candidatus Nomurabacteria bacterium]|nr:hypothetical protein [Candidatus Nomurabacteria bacterium]USN87950.1 MAG: hypothetical protein H6779_00705 [Candidatus Nomurabacteria bacterium]